MATKALTKESIGQRGKRAEKSVRDILDAWNVSHANFAYERLADARSVGGRIKAQLSDYTVWFQGVSIPLEVKSIGHTCRLPKDNLDQLPRLKKVALAGAFPTVLIHFTTIDQWRIAPASYFQFGVPSWDMSDLPVYPDAKSALVSTGLFPSDR